ncbi:MAG TPA: hypothetical protein VK391_06670 [Allosphingosinicella sp.]|nr:hypothetical protein [Allosphingosinicella sp.]
MHLSKHVFASLAAALLAPAAADSQPSSNAAALTYADIADLALAAPVAAHVRLRSASPLKGAEAGSVPAGRTRFYVEADVVSLIRSPQGLLQRVTYLADVPNGANGKAAKLRKKSEHLILAVAVPGRPGELRLVAPDAQLPFNAEHAEAIRGILREGMAADAAPRITGIGKAFHVPGSLSGESETQIFLQTADGRPVSLNVLRRPGETPRWAVALGEVVDDSAAPPQPNSLLWYRLACTLPQTLPPSSYADAEGSAAAAIQSDYRLVMERLGRCARGRR